MTPLASFLALATTSLAAFEVDFTSKTSIREAAMLKAQDVMRFYRGDQPGQTPGLLPGPPPDGPYFWWQGGALWGTMIDYWRYTGDDTYNQVVQDSLLFQVGPDRNYMPPNISATIGNDDQSFWGISAMLAAETGFRDPPPSEPQWLALAQAVHNVQRASKEGDTACGGGLRWQVLTLNNGYDYKNSIANGAYFNMAARLARYTGEASYVEEAESTFRWLRDVALVDEHYNVWDGAHTGHDCKDINRAQFSYNAAILLQGSAFMYDVTREPRWADHVNGLLDNTLSVFFRGNVSWEPACEGTENIPVGGCTGDMKTFKSFVLRWMANVAELCPWTRDRVAAAARASAEAAVQACTGGAGGAGGRACGMRWARAAEYDGSAGLGEEMSVLSALMTLLREDGNGDEDGSAVGDIVTLNTGGTSHGDPHAGEGRRWNRNPRVFREIRQGDVIGACVLTFVVTASGTAMFFWMCTDFLDKQDVPPGLHEQVTIELSTLMPPPSSHRHQAPIGARTAAKKGSGVNDPVGHLDLELGHQHASHPGRRLRDLHPPRMRREVMNRQINAEGTQWLS